MSKFEDFEALVKEVKECQLCPRMCDSSRVLSLANGPLESNILFIGEAPGRLGADQTKLPFHGDISGRNFEDLLSYSGLSRYHIFVTNAALCNPKDEKGNNSTPTNKELDNCSSFLKRQIDIIDPIIVVTLGSKSLHTLNSIEKHGISLSEGVRNKFSWYNRVLMPLYHPGQRAMIHRSMLNQRGDYQLVADTYRQLSGSRRSITSAEIKGDIIDLVIRIVESTGNRGISYFGLHKTMFLIEHDFHKSTGFRLTHAYYIRQKDGPYCVDIHIDRLKKSIPDIQVKNRITYKVNDDLFSEKRAENKIFPHSALELVNKFANLSDEKLKQLAYLRIRDVLRQEKELNEGLYNIPLLPLATT